MSRTTCQTRTARASLVAVGDVGNRYAAGDPDALRALYSRYGGPMLTAAMHMVSGERHLAEEAVQVAMVKAWRSSSSFDASRPLAPWLYAIVRRTAIDIRRREVRHQNAALETAAGRSSGDEEAFEDAWEAWAVREAIQTLPREELLVVRLAYFEGLTYPEIATRLSVPVGTVKSRASRAHRRLRAALEPRLALAG